MILNMSVVVTGTPAPPLSSWPWRYKASPSLGALLWEPHGAHLPLQRETVTRLLMLMQVSSVSVCMVLLLTWEDTVSAVINTNQKEAEKRKETAHPGFRTQGKKMLGAKIIPGVLRPPWALWHSGSSLTSLISAVAGLSMNCPIP